MPQPTMFDWLTLIAILAGPILAVIVTRTVDKRRERDNRRMDIFKTLMRTRRTPIVPDHVGALNLVEIEFHRDRDVIAQWKQLLQHFGTAHTRRPEEQVTDTMPPDERNRAQERFATRLANERQALLTRLLHAMAQALRFKIEQLEIFEGGYTPQGWADLETEQMLLRRFLLQVLAGERMFPIAVTSFVNAPSTEEPKN